MDREAFLKQVLWGCAMAWMLALTSVGMPLAGEGMEPAAKPLVEETEWPDVTAELTSVERASGNMLTIKFKYTNTGSDKVEIARLGQYSHDNVLDHVYYLGLWLAITVLLPALGFAGVAETLSQPAPKELVSPPMSLQVPRPLDVLVPSPMNLQFQTMDLQFAVEDVKGTVQALAMKETKTEIKIELSDDVLFEFDKAAIRPEAEPALQQVVEIIQQYPRAGVSIDGYTDAKGADAYNLRLSDKRAAVVKSWLVQKSSVNGKQIKTKGWGKANPVAPNINPDGSDNPDGRQKNRRVEITVKK